MAQTHTIGKRSTAHYHDVGTDSGGVVYHATRVVSWERNKKGLGRTIALNSGEWTVKVGRVYIITLHTGGWKTATTKARMNQAANQYHFDYLVVQRSFKWYVEVGGRTLDFFDGISFPVVMRR